METCWAIAIRLRNRLDDRLPGIYETVLFDACRKRSDLGLGRLVSRKKPFIGDKLLGRPELAKAGQGGGAVALQQRIGDAIDRCHVCLTASDHL